MSASVVLSPVADVKEGAKPAADVEGAVEGAAKPAADVEGAWVLKALAATAAAVVLGVIALALGVALTRRAPVTPLTVRTYHIAVEEVAWRYAPSGYDNCSGLPAASGHSRVFTVPDPAAGLIGDTYWRRRYVSYEPDGAFATPRGGDWWAHAGIQGPTLRASVGEVLRVRLLNRGRFPASLHVHGLPLASASRGAASPAASPAAPPTLLDAVLTFFAGLAASSAAAAPQRATALGAPAEEPFSSGARGAECAGAGCAALGAGSLLVAPGEVAEYDWAVGEDFGPEGAAGSVGRLYSELTYDGHVDAGLAGVVVVTPRGGDASLPPPDAAAEALALFSVSMESASPYLALNVLDYVWRARVAGALAGAPPAAAASPARAAARAAQAPSSPHVPIPAAVTPAALLAALYNAAAAAGAGGEPMTDAHPAVLAALGSAAGGLAPGQVLALPAALLGVRLGAGGWCTLLEASALGAPPGARFYLLDGSAFAGAHSQWALEGALAPLALAALAGEAGHDAGLFEESNTMHGLNGLLYCNQAALPGAALPVALLGAVTRWYVAVLGTKVDLHAAHWHGNTVLERVSRGGAWRSDSIALLPRQVATADMTAHAPGRWLFHCHVTDHIEAGMLGVYEAVAPGGGSARPWLPPSPALPLPPPALAHQLRGRLREYYIQAEVGNWSYLAGAVGAAGSESAGLVGGAPAPPCGALNYAALDATYHSHFSWSKARFVRYTDATFTTRWVPSADEAARWAHLALLGPVLRGEVGDTLRVTFRNAAPVAFSMHPHGVLYAKGSEGAPYADGTAARADTGDDAVAPGGTWPYTWYIPDSAGPGPSDASSLPWLYHGHVHEAKDEHTGLLGVLLVTARGAARVPGSPNEEDLRPADVDRELVVMSKVFSEGGASGEVHAHGGHKGHADAATDFYALNGLIACRLVLPAVAGERVRIYGVSLGNEMHTLGVSGHALSFRGRQQSGLSLLPGTMYSADTVAAGGGGWLLGSSVVHHAERGMVARFDVAAGSGGSGGAAAASAPVPAPGASLRQYYIAARVVEWDYAPAGKDLCVGDAFKAAAGELFPALPTGERADADGTDLQGFSASVRPFVARSWAALGRRYRKARYLGFTDAAFATPLANEHNSSTGLLGPALRAAPGDVLRVVLRNELGFAVNLAFPAAPLRLLALRERAIGGGAWGGAVAGSAAELAARGVAPGWEAEASWGVPGAAGPGPADPATIAWAYTSALSPDHLYAGLAGGLIVGASPSALAPGSAAHGAAREYVVAWYIANENRSPYLDHNIAAHALVPSAVHKADQGFKVSNLMHAVSGRLACNLEGLRAARGERVRFHLLGLGAAQDMHTPHAQGSVLGVGSSSSGGGGGGGGVSHVAALGLHPGTRATVELHARTPGQWLLECGVNDHWAAGMRALLSVDAS